MTPTLRTREVTQFIDHIENIHQVEQTMPKKMSNIQKSNFVSNDTMIILCK
jgi:hypothetical protein